jgi:hypothetical protein
LLAAEAGVTAEGNASTSSILGGIDATAGVSVGRVDIGAGVGASYEDGVLTYDFSGDIDLGVGIDFDIKISLNLDNIAEAYVGKDVSYTEFVDPAAAQAREQTGADFVAEAQQLQQSEEFFIARVLDGDFGGDSAYIASAVQSFKMNEQTLRSDAAKQGFAVNANSDGTFTLQDRNPPQTHVVTVHEDGMFDAIRNAF